jgi:hypothetical protein
VAASSFHAVAYAELLTLAASLELGRQIPGMARVRHSIDSDFREESRRHAFVQMELAMLARHSDANAALEASVKEGYPPVDVTDADGEHFGRRSQGYCGGRFREPTSQGRTFIGRP